MFDLYFDSLFAILTSVLVIGMLFFIIIAFRKINVIKKWGRLIILFILIGTAISALSATRDAYATNDALFAMNSLQSNICSIAGGVIFLIGIISIFLRNQKFRRNCFYIISALFIIQLLVIEVSRVILL